VHHKVPFRSFETAAGANRLDNLTTLCHSCHGKAELNLRIRSGLAGLGFVLGQLAPLFLMCDSRDLGGHIETGPAFEGRPTVVLFDSAPAGMGLSQQLYNMHADLILRALELVSKCGCTDGCPSCVGPGGENGSGGKSAALALLQALTATP
jgi:DEAD/DEAH box helicase domain-containing protein